MTFDRNIVRGFWDFIGTSRRQLRRMVISPGVALADARLRSAIARHDWTGLRAMLRPLSKPALRVNDFRLLTELGNAAFRVDEGQLGAELIGAGRQAKGLVLPTDWKGEDISDASLVIRLVEGKEHKPTTGVYMAGHIATASARAGRAILIVEPRMAPLYRRTLRDVIVCGSEQEAMTHATDRVVTASLNSLQLALGYDAETIVRLRMPLVADPAETTELRDRYLAGRDLPLIGIAWHSPQYGKDSPPLEPWIRLVTSLPAQFVSIQRGNAAEDLSALNGDISDRVLVDPSVDQMTNLDRFANQLAALDLVITMSNTGAHLAGALNRPMILVRDDLFRLMWPYLSNRVPWYGRTVVIGKNRRSWDQMFDEIIRVAAEMVVRGGTTH